MKYPKITRNLSTKRTASMFIILKHTRAKDIEDTIIVYDEDDLLINVDIDKNNKACGIELIYYK